MKTINQQEITGIIAREIPEVKAEIDHLSSQANIAGVMQIVVTFARDMLVQRSLAKVNWCMALIGWMYGRGDQTVKEMIENVYVMSFNGMRNLCGQREWQLIQQQIPANLYSIYITQNQGYRR